MRGSDPVGLLQIRFCNNCVIPCIMFFTRPLNYEHCLSVDLFYRNIFLPPLLISSIITGLQTKENSLQNKTHFLCVKIQGTLVPGEVGC